MTAEPVPAAPEGRRDQRFAFQCGGCGHNARVHVRRGFYVLCQSCGEPNPGPAMARVLARRSVAEPPKPPRKRAPTVTAPPPEPVDAAAVVDEPAAEQAPVVQLPDPPKRKRGLLARAWGYDDAEPMA